jgi:hypothetical protein
VNARTAQVGARTQRSVSWLGWLCLVVAFTLASSSTRVLGQAREALDPTAAPTAPPPLRLLANICPEAPNALDLPSFLALAAAELAPRALELVREGVGEIQVSQACDSSTLTLVISFTAVGAQVDPTPSSSLVPLADVDPTLHARVAALALATRLDEAAQAATDTGADSAPPLQTRPTTRAPTAGRPELPQAPSEPPHEHFGPDALRLLMAAEMRVFFVAPRPAFGARMSLGAGRFDGGLVGLFSRREVALGSLRTGLVAAGLSYVAWRSARLPGFSLDVGAEAGVTWGRGQAPPSRTTGHRVEYGHTGPSPFGSLGISLSAESVTPRGTDLRASFQAGWAYGLGLRDDGQLALSTNGPYAGLSLAVGARKK